MDLVIELSVLDVIREVKTYVDGERIEGNLIKPHGDGQVHKVRVVLG